MYVKQYFSSFFIFVYFLWTDCDACKTTTNLFFCKKKHILVVLRKYKLHCVLPLGQNTDIALGN